MGDLPGLAGAEPMVVVVVFAIMALAGLVHGTLGLGFPMIATPLLSLLTDVRSAILLTLLPTVAVNVLSVLRSGHWDENLRRFWPLMVFVVCGGVVGSWVLSVADPNPFRLLLATSIVLYLSIERLRGVEFAWVSRFPGRSAVGFGFVAGFLAGTVNVMVPILIIYTLEMSLAPVVMVQLFNLCFLTGKVSQMAIFGQQGLFSVDTAVVTLPLALVAAIALLIGTKARAHVAAATYRGWLRFAMWIMAALLVMQFILSP